MQSAASTLYTAAAASSIAQPRSELLGRCPGGATRICPRCAPGSAVPIRTGERKQAPIVFAAQVAASASSCATSTTRRVPDASANTNNIITIVAGEIGVVTPGPGRHDHQHGDHQHHPKGAAPDGCPEDYMSDADFYFAALKEGRRRGREESRRMERAALRDLPRLQALVLEVPGLALAVERDGRTWTLARDGRPLLGWRPGGASVLFFGPEGPGKPEKRSRLLDASDTAAFGVLLDAVLDVVRRGQDLTRRSVERAREAHGQVARFNEGDSAQVVPCWPAGGRGERGVRPARCKICEPARIVDGKAQVLVHVVGEDAPRVLSLKQVEAPLIRPKAETPCPS